jgi:cell wall assembly regulator SMI1
MSGRIPRVIGTTEEAIKRAEKEIGFNFPPSFRAWLLENNGLGIDGVDSIFPVLDERDPRKTWDSIARYYQRYLGRMDRSI